jgi:hypothetical protein
MAQTKPLFFNGGVQRDALAEELDKSRDELLQLAERVKRLVVKRSEREVFLQRLHRGQIPSSVRAVATPHHLCSLCAAEYAAMAIEHVRGCAPGIKCDQCGQPAIIWVQLKSDTDQNTAAASL